MIIMVCLDDNHGMRFHNRRQSRDRYLCKRILELAQQSVLWMNESSEKLFKDSQREIRTDPQFLVRAGVGDFCFVEDQDITPFLPRVEKIIVFRWNRIYPSDLKFPMHILQKNWRLLRSHNT